MDKMNLFEENFNKDKPIVKFSFTEKELKDYILKCENSELSQFLPDVEDNEMKITFGEHTVQFRYEPNLSIIEHSDKEHRVSARIYENNASLGNLFTDMIMVLFDTACGGLFFRPDKVEIKDDYIILKKYNDVNDIACRFYNMLLEEVFDGSIKSDMIDFIAEDSFWYHTFDQESEREEIYHVKFTGKTNTFCGKDSQGGYISKDNKRIFEMSRGEIIYGYDTNGTLDHKTYYDGNHTIDLLKYPTALEDIKNGIKTFDDFKEE